MSTAADIEYIKSARRAEMDPALDFEPPCAVTEYSILGKKTICDNPAKWIGIPPCGHEDYFCNHHHTDQRRFSCTTCGRRDMHLATYRWIRL